MSLGNTMEGRKKFVPPAIQITSMMDMFTIIVFFLLFSYSDNPDEFDLGANLELPSSSSLVNYEHALTLYLTENSIKLEEQTIGSIDGENVFGLNPDSISESELAKAFLAKKQVLETQALKTKTLEPQTSSLAEDELAGPDEASVLDPSDPHILLFCDQDVPFKVINQVIKAAGSAGFTNFQLAVMEK